MARDGPVAGVVLAAGLSSRMGRNKLLLEMDGETLLRRAVRTALAASLDTVLVVLGHEEERARLELRDLPCVPVRNPDYARGMNTSLRAGISAAPLDSAAAVVLLGDMPFVTAEMIRALVGHWRSSDAPLAISLYDGVVAPPILYGAALYGEIRALQGDVCGKRVVKQHRAEAVELRWPASALTDLDVPEDLERVLRPRALP